MISGLELPAGFGVIGDSDSSRR